MDYYYSDGQNQFGPVSLEDLRTKIDANTLVWHEGMPNWEKASNVEELKTILRPTPPPAPVVLPKPTSQTNNDVKKIEQKQEIAIKKQDDGLIVLSIIGIIGSIICEVAGISSISGYSVPHYVTDSVPFILFSGIYFFAFSIVALVKASKKK